MKSTLTSKGQITIPKIIRAHYKLKPGDVLDFVVEESGVLTLRRPMDEAKLRRWIGHAGDFPKNSADWLVETRGDADSRST